MKAVYMKNLDGFNGDARLFKVDPPVTFDDKSTEYLVVSKVPAWPRETYIFPADKKGKVLDWSELEGSMRGNHSHAEVLRAAGYALPDDDNGAPGTAGYFSMRG